MSCVAVCSTIYRCSLYRYGTYQVATIFLVTDRFKTKMCYSKIISPEKVLSVDNTFAILWQLSPMFNIQDYLLQRVSCEDAWSLCQGRRGGGLWC